MNETNPTVSEPYENRRKLQRDGTYMWSVTVRAGDVVRIESFRDEDEASRFVAEVRRLHSNQPKGDT